MITLKVYHFITHKKAESLDDCQDAKKVNEDICLYAVADGATRSFFPRRWAKLLVNHFCEPSNPVLSEENWREWLVPIQEEWYRQIEERVKARNLFYLTNSLNAREPAVSTFIGLKINKAEQQWQAVIIGDSCLFHKSNSEFKSYLVEKSEGFTSRPEAFASFPERNNHAPTFIRGEIQSGDIFILATDALAKWIVQHEETHQLGVALDQLKEIKTDDQFYSFVDLARDNENIRLVNDDVTLMIISIGEVQSSEVKSVQPEIDAEIQTLEEDQSHLDNLTFLFWVILAGIFGFVVGAIILVLIFLNKS